jgi:putative transposase
VHTSDSKHQYHVSKNQLNRDFSAERIAQKWVSDLTYIKTAEGSVNLTVILDLAHRSVVGWVLSETMRAEDTSVAAWKMALKRRRFKMPLLFDSERGVQDACNEFRKQFRNLPVIQSMSGKGDCSDNAAAESFSKRLKTEMVYHNKLESKKEAQLAVFEYKEMWYNRKRRHYALGFLTPEEFYKKLIISKMSA